VSKEALQMEAVKRVTVELATLMSDQWPYVTLVGGFAVWIQTEQRRPNNMHRGTGDVDLVLNHAKITGGEYISIREILLRHNYQEAPKKPFRYYRTVVIDDVPVVVPVDFLAFQASAPDPSRPFQEIDDIQALILRGSDLAFLEQVVISLTSAHPEGGTDVVRIQVATAPALIILKGLALNRREDKDAYDICYLIRNHALGISDLADTIKAYMDRTDVQESVQCIDLAFRDITVSVR
jgi:predicted nucleotidyltransferase